MKKYKYIFLATSIIVGFMSAFLKLQHMGNYSGGFIISILSMVIFAYLILKEEDSSNAKL